MKRNQNFDHNHSQKLLSFRYNIDTNRVEARFTDALPSPTGCPTASEHPQPLLTVGLTRRIECHRFFILPPKSIVTYFVLQIGQANDYD